MSAHNFWHNFTHGFMHGVFNNNPFWGGMNWGWSFNSWSNPFFNNYFTPFPTMMYTYPNVMFTASVFPLMPDIAMPQLPDMTFDMEKLFPTDKWTGPSYSDLNIGDMFVKTTTGDVSDTVSKIQIQNTDYSFSFSGQDSSTLSNLTSGVSTSAATSSRTSAKSKNRSEMTDSEISTSDVSTKAAASSLTSAKSKNRSEMTDSEISTSDVSTKAAASSLTSAKSKNWTEMTDSEMKQVYGNYTRDITKLYKGTASDLNNYLKGKGVLEGQGQAFIDAQNKYGISASVLVGIAMNETAAGTSKLAKEKNNVGGVRVSGSTTFKTYSSVAECIGDMARFLKAGYVDNNKRPLTKLYQINAKYCPVSDPTDSGNVNSYWARNVDKYASELESALV